MPVHSRCDNLPLLRLCSSSSALTFAMAPQASNDGTKTSSTVDCVVCRRERSPVKVLREERMSIPRRLVASHLDSKKKEDMTQALLRSVENWTVRPKPGQYYPPRECRNSP